MKKITPTYPGEMLLKEFLYPLNISQYRLAKELHVPVTRIASIVKCNRGITADTALRLSRYFKVSSDFWLGLEKRYELDIAENHFGDEINEEIKPIDKSSVI